MQASTDDLARTHRPLLQRTTEIFIFLGSQPLSLPEIRPRRRQELCLLTTDLIVSLLILLETVLHFRSLVRM